LWESPWARDLPAYGLGLDDYLHLEGGPKSLILLRGAEHARLHKWWLHSFSPKLMTDWTADRIAPIVDETIDTFAGHGHADLYTDYCLPIPPRVIAATTGLPHDSVWVGRAQDLIAQVAAAREYVNLNKTPPPNILKAATDAAEDVRQQLLPFVLERREEQSRSDFISMLWRAGPEIFLGWQHFSEQERLNAVLANAVFGWQAATGTTTFSTSGALYLILTRTDIRSRLRASEATEADALLDRLIEEALRLYTSLLWRTRFAKEDIELYGVTIKKGEPVLILNAAANRDPDQFACPHAVDLARPYPRNHVAFSQGPRVCAGQALARAEMSQMIKAALQRLPDVRLNPRTEQPRCVGRYLFRHYEPLHVVFTPSAAF
jgi:cytochrome P450